MNGDIGYLNSMIFWRDIVSLEREKYYTIISGNGGGELTSYPALGIKSSNPKIFYNNEKFNRFLNYFENRSASNGILYFDDIILPYFSYKYLNKIFRIPYNFLNIVTHPLDNIRYNLLSTFEVDLINIRWQKHKYNFRLSKLRKKIMNERWRNSLFLKKYGHINGIKNMKITNVKNRFANKLFGIMTCYDKIMVLRNFKF